MGDSSLCLVKNPEPIPQEFILYWLSVVFLMSHGLIFVMRPFFSGEGFAVHLSSVVKSVLGSAIVSI